jgi:hypothetical protein
MARRVQGVIRRSPLAAGAQAVTIWQSVPSHFIPGWPLPPNVHSPFTRPEWRPGNPPRPGRPRVPELLLWW